MRKISLLALAMSVAICVSAQEQQAGLAGSDFWKATPDIATVRAEVAKGFAFGNVKGSADPVFQAINHKASPAVLTYLLDQPGVDLARTVFEGRAYLHIAASSGNAAAADCLLAKGADMHTLDANGHTPLTYAAGQGKLTTEVIDVFLKYGLDIKKRYPAKDSANLLLLAVAYDSDLSVTDYLVKKGLSVTDKDADGHSAFYYAAKIGDVNLMKTLLQRGVQYDNDALIAAAQGTYRTSNKLEVFRYLLNELTLDPAIVTPAGQNALYFVTRKQGQEDVILFLLSKGIDVNKTDSAGNTPFMNAAGGRSVEVVKIMLPRVKDINAVNVKGESALMAAVKSASGEIVTLLLDHGANVMITDKEGNSLAYYLIEGYRAPGGRGGRGGGFGGGQQDHAAGNSGAASAGAGARQNRPAAEAPRASSQEVFAEKLAALQQKGLNVTAPLKDGNTLYHIAVTKNDLELLKKMAGLSIDINAKNKEGLTALHRSAMVSKDDAILRYLLSIGARKDITTGFGESAYDLARENEFLAKTNVSIDFLKK